MAAVVDFPRSRGILWDRTSVSSACFIKAVEVIPPLFIGSNSILSLLEELSSTDATIERKVVAEHVNELVATEGNSPVTMKSIIGSHASILKMDDSQRHGNTGSESCLTIPISPRPMSDFSLPFERESTM